MSYWVKATKKGEKHTISTLERGYLLYLTCYKYGYAHPDYYLTIYAKEGDMFPMFHKVHVTADFLCTNFPCTFSLLKERANIRLYRGR